jgi:hypothetical protein
MELDVEAVSASDTAASPLRIFLPILVNPDGSTLSEKVNAEITVELKDGVMFDWLAWGNSRCYLVDPSKMSSAVLTYRPYPRRGFTIGPRTVVPSGSWQFGRIYKIQRGHPSVRRDRPHQRGLHLDEPFRSRESQRRHYASQNPADPGIYQGHDLRE